MNTEIKTDQIKILLLLNAADEPCSVNYLTRFSGLTTNEATSKLHDLECDGLVVETEADGTRTWQLTEAGREAVARD